MQTGRALDGIRALLPGVVFETVAMDAPGDADLATDLRDSPPDFFTRTLDTALLEGRVDLALHSAKDLPDPIPEGLDWFWLPDAGDRRDVLVGSLSPRVVGVSSDRRADYAAKRFPDAVRRSVRGTIGERLRQLDEGRFDLLIMAGVALQRLGLEQRIAEWIPLADLEPPEGQGALAVTFRREDRRMRAIRDLFVKAVTFCGAGVSGGHLTLDAMRALQTAGACLHDALLDESVLRYLPPEAQRIYVGKRQGRHGRPQQEINRLLCDCIRKGRRTVRLKGGDPGIFGRLAEELDAVAEWGLPSRVIPGISAMQAAAAGSGILLTRRGAARGFAVMTPRLQGGGAGPVDAQARSGLPVVFYMAVSHAGRVADELMRDGMSADTPCALIFAAGSDHEAVYRTTLEALAQTLAGLPDAQRAMPGLLVAGAIAAHELDASLGALRGRRVLLTCSAALMTRAAQAVHDLGGRPVCRPLIRLEPVPQALDALRRMAEFDWIALTSPSAVRCLHELMLREGLDLRHVPRILSTGPGTVRALRRAGLGCELAPEQDHSAAGLLAAAAGAVGGRRVLRLRSDEAGTALADGLRAAGAEVVDCVLYENRPVEHPEPPPFDVAFFASASAVRSFVHQWNPGILRGKLVAVMGAPTHAALRAAGLQAAVEAGAATVEDALRSVAACCISEEVSCFQKPD